LHTLIPELQAEIQDLKQSVKRRKDILIEKSTAGEQIQAALDDYQTVTSHLVMKKEKKTEISRSVKEELEAVQQQYETAKEQLEKMLDESYGLRCEVDMRMRLVESLEQKEKSPLHLEQLELNEQTRIIRARLWVFGLRNSELFAEVSNLAKNVAFLKARPDHFKYSDMKGILELQEGLVIDIPPPEEEDTAPEEEEEERTLGLQGMLSIITRARVLSMDV
jgi:chromosome segregation ATPase